MRQIAVSAVFIVAPLDADACVLRQCGSSARLHSIAGLWTFDALAMETA
jgi:hypothetical protein